MSAKQFADQAFHEFSRKTHYKNGSPFLLASASASDQTQAFVFAHFSKCAHHSNPSHIKVSYSCKSFFTFLFSKKTIINSVKDKSKIIKKRTAFSISPPAFVYNSIFKTTFRQSIRISCALKDIFSGFAARIIFAAAART
mgnify:CR=1 FL=1